MAAGARPPWRAAPATPQSREIAPRPPATTTAALPTRRRSLAQSRSTACGEFPSTTRTRPACCKVSGRTALAAGLQSEAVAKLVWKRAAEIGNPEDKVVVFQASGEDAIQPDDISQGRLGDCYFLAACAAVAGQKVDTLIRDIIVEDHSDEGLYGVKFYVNGKWLTVIVDDYFPCVIDGIGTAEQSFRPLFASSQAHEGQESGVKEVWPMVLEKAWAKLHGSYRRRPRRRLTRSI